MTILVILQLIVTLDSIRNSCDVLTDTHMLALFPAVRSVFNALTFCSDLSLSKIAFQNSKCFFSKKDLFCSFGRIIRIQCNGIDRNKLKPDLQSLLLCKLCKDATKKNVSLQEFQKREYLPTLNDITILEKARKIILNFCIWKSDRSYCSYI